VEQPADVRDAYWDNAKAVLVTLVVVGHALQPAAAAGVVAADVAYRWIYLFHMPAFVLVTGVLTAGLTTRRAGRLVVGLVVPYVIFQVLQTIEVSVLRGHAAPLHVLVPRWTLWYLVALVLWRLSAPLWLALRPAVALVTALVLCVVGGLGGGVGHALALDDTLGFLPFFVAGLLLRNTAGLDRLGAVVASISLRWRVVAGLVLLAALVGTALARDAFNRAALQPGFATDAIGASAGRGTLLRLILVGAAAVATLAVLVVMPRAAHWWTSVGRASIYVYLLHALVLTPLRDEGPPWTGASVVPVIVVAAVALALVLASSPVRRLTGWAVEPHWAGSLLAPTRRAEPR